MHARTNDKKETKKFQSILPSWHVMNRYTLASQNYTIIEKETSVSKIYRYFGPYFQHLLRQRLDFSDRRSFESQYVGRERYEMFFSDFYNYSGEKAVFVTGLAGCGKSSTIRYYLNFHKTILLESGTLIAPLAVDNMTDSNLPKEDWVDRVSSMLNSVCDVVSTKKLNHQERKELLSYINKSKTHFGIKGEIKYKTEADMLDRYKEQHPVVFYVALLKLRIAQSKSIKQVIFVLDDLESVDTDLYVNLYRMMASVHTCLWDCDYKKIFHVKTLVSCRHATRNEIMRNSKYDSFINATAIEINPESIWNIVSKRLDYIVQLIETKGPISRYFDGVPDEKRFKDSVVFLREFMQKIIVVSRRDLLGAMYNFDIRLIMLTLLESVKYSSRLEKTQEIYTSGSFVLNLEEYKFSLSEIMRTMLLQKRIYFISLDQEMPPKFNIMYNWESTESDLFVGYISLLYYKRYRETFKYVEIEEECLKELLSIVFGEITVDSLFDDAVEYMRKTGAIFVDTMGNKKKIISRPRLFATIAQLRKSNILLGMFREEMWRSLKFQRANGRKFSHELDEVELFWETIYIFDETFDAEKALVERSQMLNVIDKRKFNDAFRGVSLSMYLLEGIESSFNAFFERDEQAQLRDAVLSRKNKLKRL